MHRLKTRPQFQAAMAGGTVSRTPHFALHRLALPACAPQAVSPGPSEGPDVSPARNDQALFVVPGGQGQPWLGAMVPKRWAKRAVTRNTIKRQIYALGAEFEPRLMLAAHVVRLRSGFDRQQFVSANSERLRRALREELTQLFRRACVKRERSAPPEAGPPAATPSAPEEGSP